MNLLWLRFANPGFWVFLVGTVFTIYVPLSLVYLLRSDVWGWIWNVGRPAAIDIAWDLISKAGFWAALGLVAMIATWTWWISLALAIANFLWAVLPPLLTPRIGWC